LTVLGYGKFHYFLLATCGFVSTSEEMDVISMSFILPSAECDLDLNTHTKGWLNCIIFIGKRHMNMGCCIITVWKEIMSRNNFDCVGIVTVFGTVRNFLPKMHTNR
jgi:hypothetical protein